MLNYENSLDNEVSLSGIYIALVVNRLDPKALERIRVRVIGVHDMTNTDPENSVWAEHIRPSKQRSGEIPDVGDYVYVMFLQNNPNTILWLGWVNYIKG